MHDVGGGHQVDVVAALALEPHHDICKLVRGDVVAGPEMADLMVLAENAREIAGAEEYRARAARARQGLLFTEVRPGACNKDLSGQPAFSPLPVGAPDPAGTGAKPAWRKERFQGSGCPVQRP
jgi:hypothetical protein